MPYLDVGRARRWSAYMARYAISGLVGGAGPADAPASVIGQPAAFLPGALGRVGDTYSIAQHVDIDRFIEAFDTRPVT